MDKAFEILVENATDEVVKATQSVSGRFGVIAFLTAEVEKDEEEAERVRRNILSVRSSLAHKRGGMRNQRDFETLINLSPGVVTVKKITVAVFRSIKMMSKLSRLARFFEDEYSEEITNELSRELSKFSRLRFYGYEFSGAFEFSGESLEKLPDFFAVMMADANNVLTITDDNLFYIYNNGLLDRGKFSKYGIVERTVILQPFEYTEQMIKYVFVPSANAREGALLFITFSSPLLKLNEFKAKYRKAVELRGGNSFVNNSGKPFVSFSDGAMDDILKELKFSTGRLPEEAEKILKVILIISNPSVFPMLASYIDYAGLYGASQILRGFTTDEYSRIEDIESKLDLMLRGHLNKKYGIRSSDVRNIVSYYRNSGIHKRVFDAYSSEVSRRSRWREILEDPVVAGLLFALTLATKKRVEIMRKEQY